ncbi:MAG: acyl-CoA thioesterase [Candidatus Omnitrophica bacterium]|nr:acyl-CoA thioesterase [Candidatus Omnitrophota bacterium]MCF7893918.1 acyl-CoA thioesterase [Candidatus Omnitrophota bacterium]
MNLIKKKIYYHDTDCGGVVYYANYLKYFEEARTEFFADKNIDMLELSKQGILFVVKDVNICYKKPAFYGQVVRVKTKLTKIKAASLQFLHFIEVEKSLLVSAETRLACINKSFRACTIPEDILAKLKNVL